MVIPLLLALLLGGYDVSQFVSTKVIAISAARHGARIAAELGGTGKYPAPNPNDCQGVQANGTTVASIDGQIVAAVRSAASNMSFKQVDRIDIYLPTATDGSETGGDPANWYNLDGTVAAGSPGTAALGLRCNGPLNNEVSIGVSMRWHYFPPDGIPGKVLPPTIGPLSATNGFIDYAVEKANLCSDNCLN